jgi:Leu/Phe-tRNA-protein transferase
MVEEDLAGDDELLENAPHPTATLIRPEDLRTSLGLIWRNIRQAYYVTPSWQPEFYVALAYCGFISVSQSMPTHEGDDAIPLLIPEIQRSYGVLQFANLHIERNVRKRAGQYVLRFDTAFDAVLAELCAYHEDCWLLPEYCELLRVLHARGPVAIGLSAADAASRLQVHSVELYDRLTGELVAGEVGYAIGSLWTSLTGFTKVDRHPSAGKVQLVALACVLEKCGAALWNLGHPPREATERAPASMLYKRELGATVVRRRAFLRLWIGARDNELIRLPGACAPCAHETGTARRVGDGDVQPHGLSGMVADAAVVHGIDVKALIDERERLRASRGQVG